MSGARLVLTSAHQLEKSGGQFALAHDVRGSRTRHGIGHGVRLRRAALIEPPAVQTAIPGLLLSTIVATNTRSPREPLDVLRETLTEITRPVFGHSLIRENDNDLTKQHENAADLQQHSRRARTTKIGFAP